MADSATKSSDWPAAHAGQPHATDTPHDVAHLSKDDALLTSLGYKQEFKREFSFWSTFAVSFAVMGTLPSTASTMWYGIGYGE